jgi:hypothetical protein
MTANFARDRGSGIGGREPGAGGRGSGIGLGMHAIRFATKELLA